MHSKATPPNFRIQKSWFILSFCLLAIALLLKPASKPLILELDETVMRYFIALREPYFTAMAVDVTALGSSTVITLIVCVFFMVFAMLRDWLGLAQLVFAATGAGILTSVFKSFVGRERPPLVSRLVVVSGYSFPSGHSLTAAALYVTFAILASRHFKIWWEHAVIYATLCCLVALIAITRLYLGVHYFSDDIGGMALGASWAFLIASALFAIEPKLQNLSRFDRNESSP